MWLLPQKRVLAPKIGFFVSKKIFSYPWWWLKKVANQGFLNFRPFENEQKFRTKHKNVTKNLKFGKSEYQQQLVHLLLNPGTYERIIIIQVTTLVMGEVSILFSGIDIFLSIPWFFSLLEKSWVFLWKM